MESRIQVTQSSHSYSPIGGLKNDLANACECAKRSVRRNRKPVDVWLCAEDGKRVLLLAYVSPRFGCTLTNSGHQFLIHGRR